VRVPDGAHPSTEAWSAEHHAVEVRLGQRAGPVGARERHEVLPRVVTGQHRGQVLAYANMPVFGLAAATTHATVGRGRGTAKQRLGAARL